MPIVLAIAGSDPIGGAGIQGDLKAFAAHRVYGMAVVTAITVQNTHGVTQVEPLAPELVAAQLSAVLSDIEPDAIKIGMLGTGPIVRAIVETLESRPLRRRVPIVLDPVLAATRGAALLDEAGVVELRTRLLPLVRVVTPNLAEAARLTGLRVETTADARRAGEQLVAWGAQGAIVTGGHYPGRPVDVLVDGRQVVELDGDRIVSTHTHGTGCAFASSIAARLAAGETLETAARQAKTYVAEAIRNAPGLGHGRGPIG